MPRYADESDLQWRTYLSMMTSRSSRLFVALAAIASLLFMQLAVAAYACPGANSSAAEAAVQAEAGCDEMDHAPSNLCHAHCQQQVQSIDKPVALSVPPAPSTGLHVAQVPVAGASFVSAKDQQSLLVRTTAPPLTIRNCCLRI